ncbi:hypothetical protein CHS0354_019012 [Potamilus streckersoni]|uniref:Ig-like domain-containing protein n=1 Tax=Potamilus streckersoni TaxID=2493646 RepID=A0AAE0VM00_9BIVA|nr:hypothetical protein CHS0354_019012 [Potamilus streckersoni]
MILVTFKYVLTWSIVKLLLLCKVSEAVPVVTLTPSPVYIRIGGSLTLTCQVNQDVGLATVYYNIGVLQKIWVNDIKNCGFIKADPDEADNPSFNYSVTCSGQRSVTMIKYGITSSDHRKIWNCQMVSAKGAGPCISPNNPCFSPGVTAIMRIPVTTAQLTDSYGQPLSLNITVPDGKYMQLRCANSPNGSRPESTFRWYKKQGIQPATLIEDQLISSFPNPVQVPNQSETDLMIYYSTLTLQGRKLYQGANIYCTAQDLTSVGMEVQSTGVQLIIAYAPEVSLFPNNSVYNVTVGMQDIVLTCKVIDANPQPETNAFTWKHKGVAILREASQPYTIQTVSTSDDGQYQCSAFNSYGNGLSSFIDLDVQYGPILIPMGSIEIREGGKLSVTCSHSANPVPSILWTRSGQVISRSSILEIPSITRLYDGDFICTASNVLYPTGKDSVTKTASETLKVIVLYGPGNSTKIDYNISMYKIEEGMTSEDMVCSAICKPSCSYKWLRNSAVISNQDTLSLGVVQRNMTGSYVCEAYNTIHGVIRSSTVSLEVKVTYPPSIDVILAGSIEKNLTAILVCWALGFPAETTFFPWIHMWEKVPIRKSLQGKTNTTHSVLTLDKLSLESMGKYVCTASNGIMGITGMLNQTGSISLLVRGAADILVDNAGFVGDIGLTVNMSIPFYSNPAIESFIIQKNARILMNTSRTMLYLSWDVVNYQFYKETIQLDAQKVNFVIQNMTREDFDNYTLVLSNSIGSTSFQFHLDPFGPPLKAQRFYFNRFIDNQIELHFDAGFNGGQEQTFVIEYKSNTSLDNVWKNASAAEIRETEKQYRLANGTFFIKVTTPSPGSYTYRMYSWNVKGRSPFSDSITVTIYGAPSTNESIMNPVPAIAGGVSAGFVVILIVTIGVFLWKRNQHPHVTEQEGITLENSRNASVRPTDGDLYEKLNSNANTDIEMYSSLNTQTPSEDHKTHYENT